MQTTITNIKQRKYILFITITLIAFLLRLFFFLYIKNTTSINTEGAEYGRIAENLLAGEGYMGIVTEGRNLMFPPLYPLLISAFKIFLRDTLLSAQLVSLIAGMIFIFPVFGIAKDLYGDKAGYIAMSMTAIHPILIMVSATAWIEGLYLTLIVLAVYHSLRCLSDNRVYHWLLAGTYLGLAYLTCPQAILFPFLFFPALYYTRQFTRTFTAIKAFLFIFSFIIVSLPYILYLSISTNEFRIEGKTIINNEIGRQYISNISENISGYLVTDSLEEKGVWLRPHEETAKSKSTISGSYLTTLRIMVTNGLKNIQTVIEDISGKFFLGGPLIFPLVILGLFGNSWNLKRGLREIFLLLTVMGSLAAMTTIIYMFEARYHYILIPFMIIWATKGIHILSQWARKTSYNLQLQKMSSVLWKHIVEGLIFATMLFIFAAGGTVVIKNFQLDSMSSVRRTAGEWLASIPGEKRIMDIDTITTFHAGAKWIPMPYCSSQTALKYIAKKNVNYIILKTGDIERGLERPYFQEWFSNGIPSPKISLLRRFDVDKYKYLLIYKVDT